MVVDDIFAVIAEPTRREILAALQSEDKAVGELVDELETSQPTISKHLRVLREAGLVTMRAQGQKRYYSLDREPLRAVQQWLETLDVATRGTRSASPVASAPSSGTQRVHGVEQGRLAPLGAGRQPLDPQQAARLAPANAEQPGANTGQQLGRAASRAATRAAEVLANLPKLGRKK
ncbi:ArsR/SmtB family transcription factor [Arthrobacter sp. NPDC090010]|uniref:ArsR/SmtB family transcription factor n=1 Tax=Arthrobacter sp. NPDC090010 TaxID=3363942 RepID=UPI00380F6A3E